MLLHGTRVMESVKPILDSETRTEDVKEQVNTICIQFLRRFTREGKENSQIIPAYSAVVTWFVR